MHTVSNLFLRALGLSILVTATLLSAHARAAPGDLDTGFNSTGIVTTTLSSINARARAVALQPDGKIVVVGQACGVSSSSCDFLVERLNGDGTLDKTFNTSGVATTDFNGNNDSAYAVALTLTGRIVVAGSSCTTTQCSILIVRYLSDGSYDTTFGSSGFVFTTLQSSDTRTYALALQDDGKVIVGGYVFNGSDYDFALARYNGDGSADIGFGFNGIVTTGFTSGSVATDDQVNALAVAPDGKIVAAGYSCLVASPNCEFALARYNADGILDAALMGSGKVTTPIGSGDDEALALALQPDAAIVLAGQSCNLTDTACSIALARYNSDGSLDMGFNTTGTVTTTVGSTTDVATSLVLQPDGKIIVAGQSCILSTTTCDFALVRYTSNGSPDTAFNVDGIVTTDIVSGSSDQANAVLLQPDGKIVAAGEATGSSSGAVAVARYIAVDAPWDLTPAPFAFTDVSNVDTGSVQTSDIITISGLGAGIEVPVTVLGGSYAKNGSTTYATGLGWATNGDQFNVQHTASSFPGTSTSTGFLVGGLVATNNTSVTLGSTASAIFTSTTKPGTSPGGGALGPLSLAVFLAAFIAGRYRRRQSITQSRHVAWPRRN